MTTNNTREKFIQECFCSDKVHEKIGASVECFYDKEKVADWWLKEFNSLLDELLSECGELLKTPEYNKKQTYERGVKEVLAIINHKKI